MLLEKNKVRISLQLVSSVMNHAGYKGLLNYLSLQTYKRIISDEYVNFDKMKEFSLVETKEEWEKSMDLLVEIGLAVKHGDKYITKTKLKNWKKYLHTFQPQCVKFNGFIHFDMTNIYKLRNKEDLKKVLYFGVLESFLNNKSISRGFIKDLTGVSPHSQRKMEESDLINTKEHVIPVKYNENTGSIPKFNGHFHAPSMTCFKTKKSKSNCKTIQLGNRLNIKNINICEFEFPKQKFVKSKSNLDQMNKSSIEKNDEVHWDDLSLVIDTSSGGDSLKSRGIVNFNDRRYSSWDDFQYYDYSKVNILSEHGDYHNLRNIINQ